MSSPIVVTLPAFEAGGRNQHREIGLAACARETPRRRSASRRPATSRRGSACARRASLRRGPSPTRCAARGISCRAARCRRSPSRSSRSRALRESGRCTCSTDCTATARRAHRRASGTPTECTHGTNAPSVPSTSYTARSHARHDAHADDDVGAVGDLDADVRDRTAERSHRERHDVHRASAHAAVEQARAACARIFAGATQLFVGPASSSRSLQMNVRSSTRATSDGSERARKLPGRLLRIEPMQRSRCDHRVAQALVFGIAAVAPDDRAGLRQIARSRRTQPSRRALRTAARCVERRRSAASDSILFITMPCDRKRRNRKL